MYGEADSMKTSVGELLSACTYPVGTRACPQPSWRAARESWTGASPTFAGRSATLSLVLRLSFSLFLPPPPLLEMCCVV